MTPNINHLPKEAAEIAADQGWDDTSLILHMLGFLKDNVPQFDKGLEMYFGAMADEENGDTEDTPEQMILCTFQPEIEKHGHIYPYDGDLPGELSWLVTAAVFTALTGHLPEDVDEHSYDTDRLRDATNAPKWVQDWAGPYEVGFEILNGVTSIEDIRAAVKDDMIDSARNDPDFRTWLVENHVRILSDTDVAQAFLDADLGESLDG